MAKTGKNLRTGFTTGACAAAAARAAYLALRSGRASAGETETVFPDGVRRLLPVTTRLEPDGSATGTIVKDAGDDPDVTDRAEITVRVSPAIPSDALPADHREPCGAGTLLLRGGAGVGLVTRPGLAVPPGSWAINPRPRRMIAANLEEAGFGASTTEGLLIVITVPRGEELAKKTLNPTLGVTGGISILGTSGIVVPYSHAAYVDTIRLRLAGAVAAGAECVALSTGGRTETALIRDVPERLGPETVIRIADYIADALRAAASVKVPRLIVGCMPGKLYKYACGHDNTHAHQVKLSADFLLECLRDEHLPPERTERLALCDTVAEAAALLEPERYRRLLDRLARLALAQFRRRAPEIPRIDLYLYDTEGNLIFNITDRTP